MPVNWEGWGNALQGMGAGFQGQGPAYMAAQARQQEADAYDATRQEQLSEDRKLAWMQDNRVLLYHMKNKNYGAATELLADRRGNIVKMNGDTSHTDGMLEMMGRGQYTELEGGVQSVDDEAVLRGKIDPYPRAAGDNYLGKDGGQAIFMGEDGRPYASPIPGFDIAAKSGGMASAKTTHYDNGTQLLTLPGGDSRVYDPSGREITDEQERADVLSTARKEQVDFAKAKAEAMGSGKAAGSGSGARQQLAINEGIDASKGAAIVHRGLELLKTVKTGGYSNAALKAKKLFGIESADEAELSANLGKAVLSQLRTTFGAAFTEKEGDKLDAIEAGFGKSSKGNMRLLNQTLQMIDREAQRGIKAAIDAGDYRSAADIQDMLDFRLSDEELTGKFAPAQQPGPAGNIVPQTLKYNPATGRVE